MQNGNENENEIQVRGAVVIGDRLEADNLLHELGGTDKIVALGHELISSALRSSELRDRLERCTPWSRRGRHVLRLQERKGMRRTCRENG